MANLTSVTLTAGVPTEGSGTVSTIDALLGAGASVEVVPTVTASSYTAGYVVGGIMTFASILAPVSFGGLLQSLTLKFKGSAQTSEFDVALFSVSPSNGTYADHGAPTWNALDNAALIGVYPMIVPNSPFGTHTIYNLDGIGRLIVGASQSLYAVVTTKSVPVNPASTSDMTLRISAAW